MKFVILFCAFALPNILSTTSYAAANDFKITAPANWKKTNFKFDGDLYANSKSNNSQMVVVRKFKLSGDKTAETLKNHLRETAEYRRKALARFGIGGYGILN